ncbi:TonB-dependent receptor [Chryseobacterium taklimakanense]|uniref:TonB-dependent receptor n=1 Tax=Chryseobacterium taklimakanense TaxID=536441 RepID=UPI000F5F074D|nr:carboxypeptidase-like regulatory domain-containing protein [Chryseobacterium taklimakanense]AZI21774.1 TonB-dependent receptor [Chryseobacterium taklimakanense]
MKTHFAKICFLFLVMASVASVAQIKIYGKVSFKGKGIKDINVTLKNTYDGATTDEQGNYSFETSEKGSQTLVFSHPKYVEVEESITIGNENIEKNTMLKESISEIDAVVITAGAIEASDKKRATAILSPIDIYTTAGADGQISSALNYLPGVQKVGESEGLFIRGGSGTESKIFMDGSLVNNYFSNSVPGIAGRDRFNTSLFKGNIFSSGGYSALYGQALSGVLILESVDLPETSSYDFGVSPIFLSGSFQKLTQNKNASFGTSLSYFNMGLVQNIFNYNTDFVTAPQGFDGDFNFRIKNKKGGFLKYYGSFDHNKMAVQNESLEPEFDFSKVNLNSANTSHNLSFRQKFGKYLLNVGTSYSYNTTDMGFSTIENNVKSPVNSMKKDDNYVNFKTVLERKINKITAVRGGFELNNASEKTDFGNFNKLYRDLISSAFAETDLGFSNNLSAKLGLRAEHSSYLGKTNISPRLALAYRLSPKWTGSLAYGIFYQNPESKYLNSPASLSFQKAEHYIFQLQRNSEGRSLRLEAFYKDYKNLVKTEGNHEFQAAISNSGKGYGKGLELFWRDKKTIKNIDYWLSYSFLDSKRDYLNYPVGLKPGFASEHTLSAVAKKFVTNWKTGFNLSYTYSKGRPYYDIVSQNGDNIIRHEGRLKDYNALNFSLNYLPNLGKKDSKAFTVLVLSISNILGNKNVYGYNFSNDGLRSSAVVLPVNTFVFLGAFISFGVDKTNEAINNNL